MITRRHALVGLSAGIGALALRPRAACAATWRTHFPTLAFGVISAENEADRTMRHQPFLAYLEKRLDAKIRMHHATEYAGTIEALKARKIEFARFGPASYAQAWLVTGGKVEPIAVSTDIEGYAGYHSVVVVKAEGPYRSLDDLKGKTLAFADPNSTSGYVAPSFFLREQGVDLAKHFGRTGFAGSHENGIIAVVNGTYDASVTWWTNEQRSNFLRMEEKGMVPKGSVRVVWKSPALPESPWAIHTDLPPDLKADVRSALMAFPIAEPAGWRALTDGKSKGLVEVRHADYEPVVRMIQANQRERRAR
jgi:phosphonate transport system substrate-binding protein